MDPDNRISNSLHDFLDYEDQQPLGGDEYFYQEDQDGIKDIFDSELYKFIPIESSTSNSVLQHPYDERFYGTNFKPSFQDYSESQVLPPVEEVVYHYDYEPPFIPEQPRRSSSSSSFGQRDKKSLFEQNYNQNIQHFAETKPFRQIFVPSLKIQVPRSI